MVYTNNNLRHIKGWKKWCEARQYVKKNTRKTLIR